MRSPYSLREIEKLWWEHVLDPAEEMCPANGPSEIVLSEFLSDVTDYILKLKALEKTLTKAIMTGEK